MIRVDIRAGGYKVYICQNEGTGNQELPSGLCHGLSLLPIFPHCQLLPRLPLPTLKSHQHQGSHQSFLDIRHSYHGCQCLLPRGSHRYLQLYPGPFLYKSLIEKYGERGAMIRCYLTIIAAVGVQMIDLQLTFLLSSRLILGIMAGIQASILPLYLNSIAPVSISGKIGSMNQLLTCYGVIFAYCLGFMIDQDDKDDEIRWRILVGFPILPCILSIFSLKWLFPYDSLERHIERNEVDKVQEYASRMYVNATVEDIEF